jgi:hypothetical protein
VGLKFHVTIDFIGRQLDVHPLNVRKRRAEKRQPVLFPEMGRQPAPFLPDSQGQKKGPVRGFPDGFNQSAERLGFENAFGEKIGANLDDVGPVLGGAAGVDREMGGVPDGSHHERAASQGGGESSRFHERGEENAGRGSIMEMMIRINDRRVKINGVF